MACDNVPEYPVFNATIEVRVFQFSDVLNRQTLQKVLREDDQSTNVTYNLSKTMTTTIVDTMSNANGLF